MLFFDVSAKQGTQFFQGEWDPYPDDLHAVYLGAERPQPMHVKIRTGTRPGDMIFATPNVISERFLTMLRDCDATGYTTFPVALIKAGDCVANFFGLRVYGRGGSFDEARSKAYHGTAGALDGYDGIYMDESRWDGSDVFFIPGVGVSLYVTERVAEAIKKAKLVNVQLTPNDECRAGKYVDYSRFLIRSSRKRKKRET